MTDKVIPSWTEDDFEPGERTILRAYFAMPPLDDGPKLEDLYEEPLGERGPTADPGGPVRLPRLGPSTSITPVQVAVARICLAAEQEDLLQWFACSEEGEIIGRHSFTQRNGQAVQPLADRLLCINWADSGPGISWPEDYHLCFIPGFARYVVTLSVDTPDSYGVTEWALGNFGACDDPVDAASRIVTAWWGEDEAGEGRGPWVELMTESLVNEDRAEAMALYIWPECAR
jgi:hypothetical protein